MVRRNSNPRVAESRAKVNVGLTRRRVLSLTAAELFADPFNTLASGGHFDFPALCLHRGPHCDRQDTRDGRGRTMQRHAIDMVSQPMG